jgi:hypothetical protein
MGQKLKKLIHQSGSNFVNKYRGQPDYGAQAVCKQVIYAAECTLKTLLPSQPNLGII